MSNADALVWVMSVLAIVGGLAAIFRPLAQQVAALIEAEERHRETEKTVAEIRIKFAGIETQFRNLDERTSRIERAFEKATAALEVSMDDKLHAMDEKIQMEYKAAEERLEGLSEVATKGIEEANRELEKIKEQVNALTVKVAQNGVS